MCGGIFNSSGCQQYACDGDDKTWLYENKHLPVHGGKVRKGYQIPRCGVEAGGWGGGQAGGWGGGQANNVPHSQAFLMIFAEVEMLVDMDEVYR